MSILVPDIAISEKDANLDREHMSMPELRAALRKEGITTMSEIRAILEEDGHVSVIPRRPVPA
jgi:uncharacterized membrane protein YcaP (DUF421 family)